jgi:hypothetical protein
MPTNVRGKFISSSDQERTEKNIEALVEEATQAIITTVPELDVMKDFIKKEISHEIRSQDQHLLSGKLSFDKTFHKAEQLIDRLFHKIGDESKKKPIVGLSSVGVAESENIRLRLALIIGQGLVEFYADWSLEVRLAEETMEKSERK